jgi:hypothetical protein
MKGCSLARLGGGMIARRVGSTSIEIVQVIENELYSTKRGDLVV